MDVAREDQARELLQQENLIPYTLAPVYERKTLVQRFPALFPVNAKELIEFSRGLSSLLRSGISMRDSLNILRDQSSSMGLKEVLRQVIEDIEAGKRLSEACESHRSIFDGYYTRLLRVGEATGGMASTMQQLADALEKNKQMKDKVKAALIYPIISLAVAIIVTIILVTFSLPALVNLLTEFGGEMPTSTMLLIKTSELMEVYRLHIFVAIVLGAGGAWSFSRTNMGSRLKDRIIMKLPLVKGVILRSNLFTLCSTFGTLLQAGIPSVEALRLSRDGINNIVLLAQLDQVIEDAEAGNRLGPSFQSRWPDPPLLSQGIATGEAAGNMIQSLSGLADYYEQEAAKSISAATELIQPAVILLVAAVIGFVGTAVISGIYSSIASIE